MADNITVKDASGSNVVVRSIDNTAVQLPAHTVMDATGANSLAVSSAGAAKVEGAGTAGTATGGVVTVQGVASMTPLQAVGNVASGAADSGDPVKVGGRYNSTPITLTNGQRGDLQLDAAGAVKIAGAVSVSSVGGTVAVTGAVTSTANVTQLNSNTINLGSGAADSGTQRIISATDDPVVTALTAPTTGTASSVNDTASDTTILASNASRRGATVFNDSDQILYLLLSNAASSATNFTVKMAAGSYYELPVCRGGVYTGIVKGIWASNSSGAARVTEFT